MEAFSVGLLVVHMKSSALERERPLASDSVFLRDLHGASGPDPGASK